MPRILIIDDDRDLTAMLAEYLGPEGFTVEVSHTGEDGLRAALETEYALIILDVMLPQINGLEVLRRLRARSSCRVIMLTARGQDVDRIVGLEIGADDYLSKPFNARELLARMHAVLRRSPAPVAQSSAGASAGASPGFGAGPGPGAAAGASEDRIVVGDVVMDVGARTVRRRGEMIELTSAEFDVLKALLTAAGEVVSREALFERVLQRAYAAFDRSVDNHVSSLRKKLGSRVGSGAAGVERIRSVRSAGYIYARTAPEPQI